MIANRTTSFIDHVLPALVTLMITVSVTNTAVTTHAAHSTNGTVEISTNSDLPDLSWVPPHDRFDWIQLRSGEWLKGRIKAMQDRELEFDSEELDDQTFDGKDIRHIFSWLRFWKR